MSNLPTDKKIYFIIGPTGTGKSDLAIKLSKKIEKEAAAEGRRLKAEIVSADSRQIYKDLNISSGKITKDEMENIPHHMLDIVELGKYFSVVDFTEMALRKISEIYERGNIPIVCGGTGLYIDHLLYNINLPKAPKNEKIREEMRNKNANELFEILEKLLESNDNDNLSILNRFSSIEFKNNKARLIRAIEIISKLGYYPEEKRERRFLNAEIMLTSLDKSTFKEKILKRTLERLRAGMLEEIIFIKNKYKLSEEYIKGLGFEYSLCLDFINKKIDYQNFLNEFLIKEYQYAKRQITWFKKYKI